MLSKGSSRNFFFLFVEMEVQNCCQIYLKYVQSSSTKISSGLPLTKATLQLCKMIPHQLQISGKILLVWCTFDGTNLAKAPLLLLVQNTFVCKKRLCPE